MNAGLVCPACGEAWDHRHRCLGIVLMFPAPLCRTCGGHHYALDPHDFERDFPDGAGQFVAEPWKDAQPSIGDPEPVSDEYRIVGWKRARA